MKFLRNIEAVLDWPADVIIRHFEHRLFELATAVIMIGVGLLLFLSTFVSTIFVIGGMARIVALALNGNWMPWGAYVRAAGAVVGAFTWSQWGVALIHHHVTGTPIDPDVIVYGGLALFEVVAFAAAMRGAINCERTNKQGLGHDERLASRVMAVPVFLPRRDGASAAARHEAVSFTSQN